MDPDKAKRLQSIKVITSEIIMVTTVILTVIILGFLVSGYWINSNFEVERQGLLQISSMPSGANVYIDGDSSWLQRTNTSKVLSSGEHTITLTKDGYDSWSKTVNISEGLLYRIHYPRLFVQNRTAENLLDITGTTAATISPNHNSMLLINNTTEWYLINLDTETIVPQLVDISKVFSSVSLATDAKTGLFTGEILNINWDHNSNHILFKIQSEDSIEWVLLDIKDTAKSINLTKEFGSNFSEIQILDNPSNDLLAIQNGNLHKIDVSNKSLSAILVKNIISFCHYDNEIIFSAQSNTNDEYPYYIGSIKLSNDKITNLKNLSTPAKVTISKFYDNKYITVLADNLISLYQKDDFTIVNNFELSFAPNVIKVGHDGEFIIASLENQIATLDLEAMSITEWQPAGSKFGWLDYSMIYSISDGLLNVYDFDSLNHRIISTNVSTHFPVTITNDKWLYYFSDDFLVREVIAN